jgi:hypothetical protein
MKRNNKTTTRLIYVVFFCVVCVANMYSQMLPVISKKISTTPSHGAIFISNFIWGASGNPYLMILDNNGGIMQSRYLPGTSGTDFRMQCNGKLTYYSETDLKYYVLDSNLKTIDSISSKSGYQTDNHELLFLPNGNYLLLGLTHRQQNMSVVVPGGSDTAIIVGNVIEEYDENGNIVFQWLSDQHFQVTDATREDLTKGRIDYCHANAIEVDRDGNLLLSSRHLDEITKIHRTTGDIIWRWGGKNNQFTFINDTLGFSHQHSIRVTPNGTYLLFDNGNYRTPAFSRVCEYELNTETMTATLVREFRHTPNLFSAAMGSVQYLENGNSLIGWGSNTQVSVTEVTPDNETVLELAVTGGNMCYSAYKYPWQLPMSSVRTGTTSDRTSILYPNPVNDNATISLNLAEQSDVTLFVFDELGREVVRKDFGRNSQGYMSIQADLSRLPTGSYVARLHHSNSIVNLRFIKQ